MAHEIVVYVIFGICTTAVGFGTYVLFLHMNFSLALSNTLSHAFAILFAYVTNKIWVFKALNFSAKVVIKEFLKFVSGRVMTYVIETLLLIALVDWLLYDPILSKACTSVLVVILNYVASKKVAFGKTKEG